MSELTHRVQKMQSIREITERLVNIQLGREAAVIVFSRVEDGKTIIDVFSSGVDPRDRALILRKAIVQLDEDQ